MHITIIFIASIGGPAWTYFSAVCWFYGQYLYDHLKVPIGLISSSAGGTSIEVWSSYTALKKCGIASKFRCEVKVQLLKLLKFIFQLFLFVGVMMQWLECLLKSHVIL